MLSPKTQSRLDYLGNIYDDASQKYSSSQALGAGARGASSLRSPVSAWAEDLNKPLDPSDIMTTPGWKHRGNSRAATATAAASSTGASRLQHSRASRRHSHDMADAFGRSYFGRPLSSASTAVGPATVESKVVVVESQMRVYRDYLTQLLDQVERISAEVADQDRRYQSVQGAISTFQTHVYSAESNRRFDTGMLSQEIQNLKRVVREYIPGASNDDRVRDTAFASKLQARNIGTPRGGGGKNLFGPSPAPGGEGGSVPAYIDQKAEELFRELNESMAQQLVKLNRRLLESERQQQQLIASSITQAQLRFQAMTNAASQSPAAPVGELSKSARDQRPESIQQFLDSVLEKMMAQSTELHRLESEQALLRRDLKQVQSSSDNAVGPQQSVALDVSRELQSPMSDSAQSGRTLRADVDGLKTLVSDLQSHVHAVDDAQTQLKNVEQLATKAAQAAAADKVEQLNTGFEELRESTTTLCKQLRRDMHEAANAASLREDRVVELAEVCG